ncbi:MAG: FimB/Mfa2 family fimbrial subunit [Rikenellaceae bacterium]
MRITNKIAFMVALCFVVSSCTKEDLSQCGEPYNVGLSFSYTLNVDQEDKFADQVKAVGLYIFDSNGKYLGYQSNKDITFGKDYLMGVMLDPGIYDFIVWANADDKVYQICDRANNQLPLEKGKSTFAEAMLLLKNPNGVINTELPNLFHGMVSRVQIEGKGVQRQKIMLIKNTNIINIKLLNIESVLKTVSPSGKATKATEELPAVLPMELTGNNGYMAFDNSLLTGMPPVLYKPYKVVGGTDYGLSVLRLRMEQPMMMRVIHPTTGATLLERDLTQLIIKSGIVKTNEDFDRIDTYDIVISFSDSAYGEATITINGWVVELPESDLN